MVGKSGSIFASLLRDAGKSWFFLAEFSGGRRVRIPVGGIGRLRRALSDAADRITKGAGNACG